jgi:hypothetical protein
VSFFHEKKQRDEDAHSLYKTPEDVLTVMITPIMMYNFTFFQNIERARLRLVLRKVTDYKANQSTSSHLEMCFLSKYILM